MRQAVALGKRTINVRNKKLDDDEFWRERKKAIGSWPTGRELDLDEAIEYQKKLPEHRIFTKKAQRATKKILMFSPACGRRIK